MSLSVMDLRNLESNLQEDMRWNGKNVSGMCETTGLFLEGTFLWICGVVTELLGKHCLQFWSLQVKNKSWRGSRRWVCALMFFGKMLRMTHMVFMNKGTAEKPQVKCRSVKQLHLVEGWLQELL